MNIQIVGRIVSLLAGAATLATLHYGWDLAMYVALPAGLVVYTVGRLAFALFATKAEPH